MNKNNVKVLFLAFSKHRGNFQSKNDQNVTTNSMVFQVIPIDYLTVFYWFIRSFS